MSLIKINTTRPRKAVRVTSRPEINANNQDLADITDHAWVAIKKENKSPRPSGMAATFAAWNLMTRVTYKLGYSRRPAFATN